MVEEDAAADARGGMDVGLEHLGRAALQIERKVPLSVAPEPMRQPVRLQRVEALEVEERLDETLAGRVAVEHGGKVGLETQADFGRCARRALERLQDQRLRDDVVLQPRGDAVEHRGFEARLVQDRVQEQRRQHRRFRIGLLGVMTQLPPQRVGEGGLVIQAIDRGVCLSNQLEVAQPRAQYHDVP